MQVLIKIRELPMASRADEPTPSSTVQHQTAATLAPALHPSMCERVELTEGKLMRRQLLFAAVIIIAFSTGASAQSGTGMTGPRAGTGTGSPGQAGQGGTMDEGGMAVGGFGIIDLLKGGKNEITMTGCLARGDRTEADAAHVFVLTDVRTGAPSSESSVHEAVGTTGTVPVTLRGNDSDLQKHVGRRVQLRGKWDESSKGVPTNGVPFKVSAVKDAEGNCSAPTSSHLE